MNKLIAGLYSLMLAVSPLALAQDKKAPSEEQLAYQQKMKDCNKEAGDKNLKGDKRKSFMSSCLKSGGLTPKQQAQQQKMADCNKQAAIKKLEGDARKGFMSSCLKG